MKYGVVIEIGAVNRVRTNSSLSRAPQTGCNWRKQAATGEKEPRGLNTLLSPQLEGQREPNDLAIV